MSSFESKPCRGPCAKMSFTKKWQFHSGPPLVGEAFLKVCQRIRSHSAMFSLSRPSPQDHPRPIIARPIVLIFRFRQYFLNFPRFARFRAADFLANLFLVVKETECGPTTTTTIIFQTHRLMAHQMKNLFVFSLCRSGH